MVYVLVFMGEFGVELLNWQGVVRKFSETISSEDTLVCCSRGSVYAFYENADIYIDISEVESFKKSQASGYSACLVKDNGRNEYFRHHLHPFNSFRAKKYQRSIEKDLKKFITSKLQKRKLDTITTKFIFSSKNTYLNGCHFGIASYNSNLLYFSLKSVNRRLAPFIGKLNNKGLLLSLRKYLRARSQGDIYDLLDIKNNIFKKIEADLNVVDSVEKKLGWKLTEPFILCQTRRRDIPQICDDSLSQDKLNQFLEIISKASNHKIILLSFNTGRANDSYSALSQRGCWSYSCENFPEQACLIQYAKHCLFFTEGDLGSHIYVPPMMGKDVTMIAPETIYDLESAPIEFWNKEVFTFGGQILKGTVEKIFKSTKSMQDFSESFFLGLKNEAQQSPLDDVDSK